MLSAFAVVSLGVFTYALILYFTVDTGTSGAVSTEDSLMISRMASGDSFDETEAGEFMEKLKPFSPLLDVLRDYETKLQDEYNRMKTDIAALDMEKILSTTIDEPDKIDDAAAMLARLDGKLRQYKARFDAISENTAAGIRKTEIGNKALLDSIYNLVAGGDYNINEYFSIQESFIQLVSKLQKFLTDKKGEYKLEGEKLVFTKAKDQKTFSDFGNKLLDLWQKEKEWLVRIKQQEGITDEEIHTQIENCL